MRELEASRGMLRMSGALMALALVTLAGVARVVSNRKTVLYNK